MELIWLWKIPLHLRLLDKLSNKKNRLSNNPKILVCGPTLYDDIHVGHARVFILSDVLVRLLRSKGLHPVTILNMTDIDPKIFQRHKCNSNDATNNYFNHLLKDFSLLGIADSFIYVRTSNYVQETKKIIKKLLEYNLAYSANGNIYLDTSKFKTYGRLSHLSKVEMLNRRYDIDVGKKSHNDILLWNTNDYYGILFHDKILGAGTPWWHIQDTAVSYFFFKSDYDVHIGASDLSYPHHEVLLATLQAITKKQIPVRCWLHVGLLKIMGEKMSKSSKNAIYVKDLLKKFNKNVIKMYLLSVPYKNIIDFSLTDIKKYEKYDELIRKTISSHNVQNEYLHDLEKFYFYLENDLDIPNALKYVFKVADSCEVNALKKMVSILGFEY